MNTRGYFFIFFFTFSDTWDLSASQNESVTQTHITVTEEYGTAWEKQVTLAASDSSSHKSITHTTALIRTSVLTSESQNAPPPTSAPCSQVHAGSFLGGMLLAFIIISFVCLGYKLIGSRQRGRGQGRYRALDQHDAII